MDASATCEFTMTRAGELHEDLAGHRGGVMMRWCHEAITNAPIAPTWGAPGLELETYRMQMESGGGSKLPRW